MFYERSEDYRPLFWMMGRPIYVNTAIFLAHIIAFFGVAIAASVSPGSEDALSLNTYRVFHGEVWRLVSYIIFWPSSTTAAINFIFAMGFLFYFGRQVEEFVGRKVYSNLYAALVFIPAILLCLIGLRWPLYYLGGYQTVFGVFVAFATIYPGVIINIWFVNLEAKNWAFVLLAVLTATYAAYHDWIGLGGLWCDALIGYGAMRLIGGGYSWTWLTDWFEERRIEKLTKQRNFKVLEEKKANDSIDFILEKISKQGVDSLNAQERAALERARTNLLKRDQR